MVIHLFNGGSHAVVFLHLFELPLIQLQTVKLGQISYDTEKSFSMVKHYFKSILKWLPDDDVEGGPTKIGREPR